jgi:hypothetical protein
MRRWTSVARSADDRVNYRLARPTKQKATLRPTLLPVHRGRPDAQNDAVVDEEPNPAMTDAKSSECAPGHW